MAALSVGERVRNMQAGQKKSKEWRAKVGYPVEPVEEHGYLTCRHCPYQVPRLYRAKGDSAVVSGMWILQEHFRFRHFAVYAITTKAERERERMLDSVAHIARFEDPARIGFYEGRIEMSAGVMG